MWLGRGRREGGGGSGSVLAEAVTCSPIALPYSCSSTPEPEGEEFGVRGTTAGLRTDAMDTTGRVEVHKKRALYKQIISHGNKCVCL